MVALMSEVAALTGPHHRDARKLATDVKLLMQTEDPGPAMQWAVRTSVPSSARDLRMGEQPQVNVMQGSDPSLD
jgi:hypothetical protein